MAIPLAHDQDVLSPEAKLLERDMHQYMAAMLEAKLAVGHRYSVLDAEGRVVDVHPGATTAELDQSGTHD